ncbi:hypothetical protein [Serratia quinivorans]|uniref:hypothetical protein n=1 Tax=Serratia quinivorans TaxID=137545 RepID=UPI0034C5BA8A
MSKNNEESLPMRYEEMNLESDFALYQRLASENMTPIDLLSGERRRTGPKPGGFSIAINNAWVGARY